MPLPGILSSSSPNVAQASITEAIHADPVCQQVNLNELHFGRAYSSSTLVRERPADLPVYCQAWPVHNGIHFPKTAFELDWKQQPLRCLNNREMPFAPGGIVHFPAETCAACPVREQCTPSQNGRSVNMHLDEQLLWELCQRQLTPAGRSKLRKRVAVEHALAHIGRGPGRRSRYRGIRNNLFEVRRSAIVHNVHVIARLSAPLKSA